SAAVEGDDFAGEECGVIACEEDRETANIRGAPRATDRMQALQLFAGRHGVGAGVEVLLAQVRIDPARSDRVAANPAGPQVDGEGAGHAVNARLRGAIRRVLRVGAHTFDRTDIDDAPACR